jgi:hypothetical protein
METCTEKEVKWGFCCVGMCVQIMIAWGKHTSSRDPVFILFSIFCKYGRFEALKLAELGVQAFWNLTVCCWMSSS